MTNRISSVARLLIVGLLAGVLGGITLMASAATSPSGLSGTNTAHQAPATNSANYEQWLNNRVRHELAMLPWYSVFDTLGYRIDGTTVILEGQVARASLKPDAEGAVKHIEGVEKVVNNIEVLPLSPMDNQIRMATFRAIYGNSPLGIYGRQPVPSIHIIVKNGNVTLTGAVDNEMDKNLASIRANGVSGVFSVTNNLVIERS
jgi:hyperosmotically inducible protein